MVDLEQHNITISKTIDIRTSSVLEQRNELVEFFLQLDEIGNNANTGIRGFTTWIQKKISNKLSPLVMIVPGPIIANFGRFEKPVISGKFMLLCPVKIAITQPKYFSEKITIPSSNLYQSISNFESAYWFIFSSWQPVCR